jgi:hypothetical protein
MRSDRNRLSANAQPPPQTPLIPPSDDWAIDKQAQGRRTGQRRVYKKTPDHTAKRWLDGFRQLLPPHRSAANFARPDL